jgi:hypothetical protein
MMKYSVHDTVVAFSTEFLQSPYKLERINEMYWWLRANVADDAWDNELLYGTHNMNSIIGYSFTNPEDAVAFTLRFGL